MKVLSREEIDEWLNTSVGTGGVHIARPTLRKILHTAREYHRLRTALEYCALRPSHQGALSHLIGMGPIEMLKAKIECAETALKEGEGE